MLAFHNRVTHVQSRSEVIDVFEVRFLLDGFSFENLGVGWRGGGRAGRRRAGHHPIILRQDIGDNRDQHQHDRNDEAPVLMEFSLGVFRLVVMAHKNED